MKAERHNEAARTAPAYDYHAGEASASAELGVTCHESALGLQQGDIHCVQLCL